MSEHSYTPRRSALAGTLGLLLLLALGALLVWRSEAAATGEPQPARHPLYPTASDEHEQAATGLLLERQQRSLWLINTAAAPLAVEGLAISATDGPIIDLNMWNWSDLAPGSCVLLSAGADSPRPTDDQPCDLIGIANVDDRFFQGRLTISSDGAPLTMCDVSLIRCTVSIGR